MVTGALVRLRAVEPDDAEPFHSWWNDPEVTRTTGIRYPLSLAVERQWVEAQGVVSYTSCHFAVETLDDGVLLGVCGLYKTALPENRSAEMFVQLGNKEQWGRGYGTDTVRTLCRFGFEEMSLHRIELLVFAHHTPARRVYEKLGFVQEAVAREAHWGDGRWYDDVHMSLLEGELR